MEYPTILVKYCSGTAARIRYFSQLHGPSRYLPGLLALLFTGPALASTTLCQDALWPYEVQGPGDASPLEGKTVTVRGTVTFTDARRDGLRGFFIQGPTDDNPETSEALFIYAPGHTPTRLDDVVVTGEVKEFFRLTELTSVQAVTACGRSALPAPLALTRPTESLENMRVALPATQVIDNYRLLDVGELVVSDGAYRWTLEDGSTLTPCPGACHRSRSASLTVSDWGPLLAY